MTDIPSRAEPDPKNLRQRSFQGGADSLPDASPAQTPPPYRQMGQTAGATVSDGAADPPFDRDGGEELP